MQGQLFSTDFIARGITETAPWRELDDAALNAFIARLRSIYGTLSIDSALNEGQTEDELVEPLLAELGWGDCWISQVNLSESGREDVPDFLLFPDSAAKDRALQVTDDQRARHGIALLEAKRWLRVLDRTEDTRGNTRKKRDFGAPSSQMLRYLSRVDVMSDRAVKWGVLTNGAVWRLYWQDARSRAEDFFEIDVAAALGIKGIQQELDGLEASHALKLFFLLFHRAAFLPQSWDAARRTFHAIAQREARNYEESVSQKLGERVFAEVFPSLANALAASDLQASKDAKGAYTRAYLDELREASLVLLYRLLFVLYAEDRRLLPVMDSRYAPYSLSELREQIAQARDGGKVLSGKVSNYWSVLDNLFVLIAEGDDQVGMPAYNGGLFERARAPILARVRVPDAQMAPVIDALSRRVEELHKPRINYRDLSVAHLGSIYERLLEYTLVQEEGALHARPASFARKVSGSYYTHDDLVRLILDEAVGKLVEEKLAAFDAVLKGYATRKSLKPYEWDALEKSDPPAQLLELKICDPAMGSGHFLVALVDWLADRILEAIDAVDEDVNAMPWAAHLADKGAPYSSPVVVRVADIRQRILKAGKEHNWALDARQLDDRHIVRRMILKKVIFGVDKNPMAVELAKVALWLHTFTVGAPLSFLDHHLKCGDSLHGEKLDTVRTAMQALGTLFQDAELARLELAAKSLEAVSELTDTSIAEAHESKKLADEAAEKLAPIHALLDFWRALRWLVPGWPTTKPAKIKDETARKALAELFSGRRNLVGDIMQGTIEGEGADVAAANDLLARASALARREHFFHWWTAFPTVWRTQGSGGFDAVIGNPPWDVLELEDGVWFFDRERSISMTKTSAERDALIEKLKSRNPRLWNEFHEAKEQSNRALRVIRESSEYPFFSSGKVNLYRLFVERCTALGSASSVFGLLVPSGISADAAGSKFFRKVADDRRVLSLFDFENRGNPGGSYFPDVDARTKFCVFVFGGVSRITPFMSCAFYLKSPVELRNSGRILRIHASDLLSINPNTASMPMLSSQKDADLTAAIYRSNPVLVLRDGAAVKATWPIRYKQGTHNVSSDSASFVRPDKLDSRTWEVDASGHLSNGQQVMVRLFEGKMVQMYDHRAATIKVNPENLRRPAQEVPTTAQEKADPKFSPKPQYYVPSDSFDFSVLPDTFLALKDVTSPTNVRGGIFALLPKSAAGHTLPVLLPMQNAEHEYPKFLALLLANLNSFVADYCLRQKLQTQHVTLGVLEQLPVIPPERFEQSIGGVKIADFIRAEVLALTYTAHDMAPFARDMGLIDASGQVKPPVVWDAHDRAHRMARLDALFMLLYGIGPADADYILSTFPIVREKDQKAHGRYRTRDLILAYMAQMAAGKLAHTNLDEDVAHQLSLGMQVTHQNQAARVTEAELAKN
jgi:hypothetical protein